MRYRQHDTEREIRNCVSRVLLSCAMYDAARYPQANMLRRFTVNKNLRKGAWTQYLAAVSRLVRYCSWRQNTASNETIDLFFLRESLARALSSLLGYSTLDHGGFFFWVWGGAGWEGRGAVLTYFLPRQRQLQQECEGRPGILSDAHTQNCSSGPVRPSLRSRS